MQQEDADTHAAWVENAGFIYDRLLVQKLKWPSLTFQWLPFREHTATQTNYRCLYATHSSGGAAAEHLVVAEVSFPHLRDLQEEPTEMQASKIRTIYRHTHESEINRARCCPTEPELIAARCDNGPVCLFRMGSEYPAHLLEGNLNGGFALDWSEWGLVSGDFDGKAYFWPNPDNLSNVLEYGSSIEDVKWAESSQLAIVGDNGCLSFWDLRSNSIVQQTQAVTGEKKELYTAAVNPVQRQLVLTGGEDETVRIWDRRNLSAGLHKFEGHEGSVMSVEWSKVNGTPSYI
jgi:histone-binding protein RBBP4